MKLGFSTWGMPTVPIDQAVAHIAGLGYEGIEITIRSGWTTDLRTLDAAERKRILGLVAQHGLTLSAIGHASILERDPEAQAQSDAWIRDAVDLAVEWAQPESPPALNVLSGGRTEEWDDRHETLVERLADAAAYAQTRGVTLAMEPHVDLLVDTPERMIWVLEQVGSPHLRVNFDISHFDVLGMTIAESVAALVPYAVHTHVKDQRGRHPHHEFLTPGEGDFDYVAYLRAMQAQGYDGFITAEVSLMRQRKADYDPLAAATLSYRTLSGAFEQAGIARR